MVVGRINRSGARKSLPITDPFEMPEKFSKMTAPTSPIEFGSNFDSIESLCELAMKSCGPGEKGAFKFGSGRRAQLAQASDYLTIRVRLAVREVSSRTRYTFS
jgi:hypothetical protein